MKRQASGEPSTSPAKRAKLTGPATSSSGTPRTRSTKREQGPTSTRIAMPTLPNEILMYLREILIKGSMKGTAAELLEANGYFYNLFLPVLEYERLVLGEKTADGICNIYVRALFRGCCPDCFMNHLDKPRPLIVSPRKPALLRQCRYLTLKDRAALNALLEAHEYLEPEDYLFPNVMHLSLTGDLLWSLAVDWARESTNHKTAEDLHRLIQILRPYHLCVHFKMPNVTFIPTPSETLELYDVRMATEEEEEDMEAEMRALPRGITRIVEEIHGAWPLDSLTCHNVTSQPFPVAYSPLHRVIFRPNTQSSPETIAFSNNLIGQMADAICWLGPPDESKFEFIGVENIQLHHQGTLISTIGEGVDAEDTSHLSDVEDNASNPVETSASVIDRVWEQIPQVLVRETAQELVSFLSLGEATPCVCCGTL